MVVHTCIAALSRLRQEVCKFKASLSHITRPCLKTTTKGRKKEGRKECAGSR
jgi:hypothetical protein